LPGRTVPGFAAVSPGFAAGFARFRRSPVSPGFDARFRVFL